MAGIGPLSISYEHMPPTTEPVAPCAAVRGCVGKWRKAGWSDLRQVAQWRSFAHAIEDAFVLRFHMHERQDMHTYSIQTD